ncbi:MAG: histidine kinase [Propionibacteriaceae bacterium]|nr:histidine kinase [Propionibacteriaceae bacterium]
MVDPVHAGRDLGRSPGPGSAVNTIDPVGWRRAGTWLSGIWLIFLALPIVTIAQADYRIAWKAAGWALILAFAGTYLGALSQVQWASEPSPQRRGLSWLALLLGITALLVPFLGYSTVQFSPYLLSFAALGLPKPARWIAPLLMLSAVVAAAWAEPSARGILLIDLALLGICVPLAELTERTEAWEEAERSRLVLAERDRIARDMHDLIGHSLTVINLKVQLAQRLLEHDTSRAQSELAEVRGIVAQALTGVRHTVSSARIVTASDELEEALGALDTAGVEVRVSGSAGSLTGPMAMVAGWILKEATTNIIRHAVASRCVLSFEPRRMLIADDGTGFSGTENNGLRGMRERVAAAGGTLRLGVSSLGGAEVEVTW